MERIKFLIKYIFMSQLQTKAFENLTEGIYTPYQYVKFCERHGFKPF